MRKDEYLKVLGLSSLSSLDEVKRAKRALLMEHHPDLNPDAQVTARRRTQEILEAYDALMSMWDEPAPTRSDASRASSAQAAPEVKTRSFVRFCLGSIALALDAAEVQEVIPLTRLMQEGGASPVPNRVLWRGKSTILVDPRRAMRLACAESPRRAKVIITGFKGSPVGLIVDEVEGLKKVVDANVLAVNESPLPPGFCRGAITTDEGRSYILSLEKMFTSFSG